MRTESILRRTAIGTKLGLVDHAGEPLFATSDRLESLRSVFGEEVVLAGIDGATGSSLAMTVRGSDVISTFSHSTMTLYQEPL